MVLGKRIVVYLTGLFLLPMGNVLFTCCRLGASAVVTLPNALAETTALSLGTASTLSFILYVLLQWMVSRKADLKLILQFPLSLIFGGIMDFYNQQLGLQNFRPENLLLRWGLLAVAIIFTGLGAFLMLRGGFILNPADGIVQAVSFVSGLSFGQVKLRFDATVIAVAAVVGLLLSQRLIGIGAGTVVAMLCIGRLFNWFDGRFPPKEVEELILEE